MYQRKYCRVSMLVVFECSRLTWLVQTLLKVTKAKVWASIVSGRSFLDSASGINTALSSSCGRKASRSSPKDGGAECRPLGFGEELRYRIVL